MIRKSLSAALAALTLATTVASPAFAEHRRDDWRRYDRRHHNGDDAAAAAVVAGIVGLAIGAAIAGSNRGGDPYYRNRSYYSRQYSGGQYPGSQYPGSQYYGGQYSGSQYYGGQTYDDYGYQRPYGYDAAPYSNGRWCANDYWAYDRRSGGLVLRSHRVPC